jgi:hypothetical protein
MPNTSIVFDPELDERQLDREVSNTNDALSDVATDLPTSFEDRSFDTFSERLQDSADGVVADIEASMDAMTPDVGGLGDAVGGGGMGATGAGAAAGLASRIPKPVAGVAAAALPVALAGGVGAGMLSAMQNASARMQTSATLMGQAWNNVWRPIGDRVDELFIRPVAKDLLSSTQDFEDLLREGKPGQATEALVTGRDPREASLGTRLGGILGAGGGGLAGAIGGAKAGGALGATLGSIIPGAGTAIGGTAGAILGGGAGLIAGTGIGGRLGSALGDKIGEINVPEFPEMPDAPELPEWGELEPELPEWADLDPDLPEWSDMNPELPEWSNLEPGLPNWLDLNPELPDWLDLDPDLPSWDDLKPDLPSWENLKPDLPDWSDLKPDLPDIDTGGGIDWPGNQRGSVVRKPTPMVAGEAGPEVIAPYAEFRRTIEGVAQQAAGSGGGGADVDMTNVERKLDDLNRNIKALRSEMDVTLEVDKEVLGRATKDAEQNRLGDTNPSV